MTGSVDPETLYTKQSCIGKSPTSSRWYKAHDFQVGVALERSTKGESSFQPAEL